jgi:formimidoylglutamate deiminase
MPTLFQPDLLLAGGVACADCGLLVGDDGHVLAVGEGKDGDRAADARVVRLRGKALLPGLANAHSHTFQRLFRARAEGRAIGGDTFWTWREQMYRAAAFCAPQDLYDVARATFLEMLASGITVVGEFHYLHNDPDGRPYADGNTLANEVIRAAQSVGIRICLLRSAYQRAGFARAPHAGQRRFYETAESYLRNLDALLRETRGMDQVTVGAAPHSIRAVPVEEFAEIAKFAAARGLPLHTHLSEQIAENEACAAEYGQAPAELLAARGLLTPRTTLVHAIHLSAAEFAQVARAATAICSCPTTERNLGDGIFPADVAARLAIPVALGTDSQAQIDILEDARQSEYHLRLERRERGILDGIGGEEGGEDIAARLWRSATTAGYGVLGLRGGSLAVGQPADFFTFDVNDLGVLGVDRASLAAQAVFALGRAAIRDVAVQGRMVIEDGRHAQDEEIRSRFRVVERRFAAQEA